MATMEKTALTSVLFFSVLCLMTLQKISMMMCLRMLLSPMVSLGQGYAILSMLLVGPYLFSALLVTWNTPFLRKAREHHLPPLRSIALGVFSAFVEGGCIVAFTTRVMALLPVYVCLPATQGVLGVSSLVASLRQSQDRENISNGANEILKTRTQPAPSFVGGAKIMASVLCMLIYPAVACFLYNLDLAAPSTSLCMALVPTLLGLVWTRDLQLYVLKPFGHGSLLHERFRLVYCSVKILSIVLFLLIEIYCRSEISDSRSTLSILYEGFNIFNDTYVFLPLFLYFLTSILAYAGVYTSLAFREPSFGITMPSIVSMVLSIIFCVIAAPNLFAMSEIDYFGLFPSYLICASFLAWGWAWPYILNSMFLLAKPHNLLTPHKALFTDFGWNPVFADQRLLLGFHCPKNPRNSDLNEKIKTRIYICTTMYREADYEMERLLLSLIQLISDPLLKDVYFESNIFMDNGCKGNTLTEFALQFISLLDQKAGVSMDKCRCWSTPYGLQISCKLAGGFSLFLHLKDPQKVKAKKRWSQSMYINYVMKFRKSLWRRDISNKKSTDGNFMRPLEDVLQNKNKTEGSQEFHVITKEETGEVVSHDINYTLRRIFNVGYPTCGEFTSAVGQSTGQTSSDESGSPCSDSSSQGSSPSSSTLSADHSKTSEESCKGEVNQGFQSDDFHPDRQAKTKSIKPISEQLPISEAIEKDKTEGNQLMKALSFSSPIPSTLVQLRQHVFHDVIKEDIMEEVATEDGESFHLSDSELVDDDHTFILATDADMAFRGEAVKELLQLCASDMRIGAACGRTHPIGKRRSPIVWHQVFEYAKDFWMIKNAQNIIGSVSCCPGCFSLYRASAIRDVMDKYSSPTRSPFTVYVKDTGEDRWMATLMMINGWRMRYSPFADNSTFCPDTFEEYYKQRKRWILSDMANAVLAVQNILRLIRNNECFSLIYVIYLINMFLNTVITPGTAIVMITAGLELVFDIPYLYTTPPLASVVYLFAILCTCTSHQTQVKLLNVLTVLMGGLFSSVALYGCFKITSVMVKEALDGSFHFQQHYMILLLALSLVYAALMHPRESHQIVYGFAYMFIFPAMHVLLPLYSIANIIDQSWGTRDENRAKIPKFSCLPNLKRIIKLRKRPNRRENSDDARAELQNAVSARLTDMSQGGERAVQENHFWQELAASLVGVGVNTGLEKAALAQGLRTLRNRTLATFLAVNAVWLGMLSYFYLGADSPLARLNIYGVMSAALYGFTLAIQLVGLTASRLEQLMGRLARGVYRDDHHVPVWVHTRESH